MRPSAAGGLHPRELSEVAGALVSRPGVSTRVHLRALPVRVRSGLARVGALNGTRAAQGRYSVTNYELNGKQLTLHLTSDEGTFRSPGGPWVCEALTLGPQRLAEPS